MLSLPGVTATVLAMSTPNTRNVRDAADAPPRLACFLNMGTLGDLPAWSTGPRGAAEQVLEAVAAAGFDGVQGADAKLCRRLNLPHATGGRINTVQDADRVAQVAVDEGALAATVHVGWGLEDDATVDRLVDATLEASARHDMPIYIETHRATVTQDIWRTVALTGRRPQVRFNGDFSHWYTGLEMVYGGFEKKLDYAAPVLERVRFLHGRIGSPGCMQVDIGRSFAEAMERPEVQHFVEMWTRCFAGFLRDAQRGDLIVFAPELLPPGISYARQFPDADGNLVEEGDRWQQALLYCRIARHCFDEARHTAGDPPRPAGT